MVRGDFHQAFSPMAMGSAGAAAAEQTDEFVNESLGFEAQPDSSDVNGDSNAGHPRRLAWSRPSNGDIEVGSVMMGGAVSWPALSESTRPVTRSPSNSTRPVYDGSASSSQAPLISHPLQRQTNAHSHTNLSANNSARPRSRHRGGGSSGSGPSHNNFNRPSPPAPPPFPVYNVPYRPMLDTLRPPGGAGRNNPRRGDNYGSRPRRSDGPHHTNYRRHQDRRDAPPYMSAPPPPTPMGYMPSPPLPPGVPSFLGPPPLRAFAGQMGFDMHSPFMFVPQPLHHPESFRAVSIVASSPPPMIFPPPANENNLPPPMIFPLLSNENNLQNMIVKQIDYYFSDDNLAKDNYLRSKMDDNGWVPIKLIANFHRVEQLTKDIQVILDAMRHSTVLELQGEKIRRRVAWNKWIHSSSRANPQTTFVASV